jgi:YfiH family protein
VADGAVTELRAKPLVVMTADCLPVVACDRAGSVIGAFHAGWKGLLAGVLEEGLAAMNRPPADLVVWIGPAIGPASYQVGPEVQQAFVGADPAHEADFVPDGPDRWRFDLAGAAARRLGRAGVGSVTASRWDTYRDTDLFFSHRRQTLVRPGSPCGRQGTFIVLESAP